MPGMLAALRGAGRWVLLLVWLLAGVGCSAGRAATLVPPPSPTVVIFASPTSPPPTASLTVPAATEPSTATVLAATLAPTETSPPASTATPTPDPALAVIYSYLDARARANVSDVTALACAAWQGQAATEAVSFRSMQAKLQDVVCTVNGVSGAYTLVGCGGKIITTYGTETREWDLSNFIYQAVIEDGQWKMCGYN
jgi:hypothetical protein